MPLRWTSFSLFVACLFWFIVHAQQTDLKSTQNGPEITHKGAQTNKVKELHQPEEVIRKRGPVKFKELLKL
jgi:hypothetical protein